MSPRRCSLLPPLLQNQLRESPPVRCIQSEAGDWLEISNRGKIFWKAPMKELTPGGYYFAVVPDEFLTAESAVWAFYLNRGVSTESAVYIPLSLYHPKYDLCGHKTDRS